MFKKLLFLSFVLSFLACSKEIIQQKLSVDVSPIDGGTVSPSSNVFEKGTQLTLLASPSTDYQFREWRGSLSGNTNPLKLTLDSDKQVTGVFEKKVKLPTVSLEEKIAKIGITSADFTANIVDNGGGNLINFGFCWSQNPNPTINDFKVNVTNTSLVNFNSTLKGLKGGTTYYVSAFATNLAGTSYSPIKNFKTLNSIPISNCQLPEMYTHGGVGIGFPRIKNRVNSVGEVKVHLIFVDFSDVPATKSIQSVFSILSPTAENYFNEVSYGKMKLKFIPTTKWYRMSKLSNQYNWDNLNFYSHKQYLQEAVALSDNDIDFSSSDAFIIIANPEARNLKNGPAWTANPGIGIKVDGKEFLSSATSGYDLNYWGGLWFNHEFGHDMGLVDLYAYQGNSHRFVGEYSIMGLINGAGQDLFGWEKWLLGWISDDQIVCVNSGNNSAVLSPLEAAEGTKLLIMSISKTSAIVIESRQKMGYDKNIPKVGPLVYIVDTGITTGAGTIKVLPFNESDTKKLQSPLEVGQVINYGSYSIKFISTDINGDLVEITTK